MHTPDELWRRSRGRWRYARKQTRRRARSWVVALPGARTADQALWICSWQRSGSTWLAEMMSADHATRLVYEPANVADEVFDGTVAARTPLPREGDPAVDDVVAALAGTLRGAWVDQLNEAHLERRRVVKDVRALALAGAVRDRLPATPVIILVRHPVAVARSVVDLGWAGAEPPADAFAREVTAWCEQHEAAFGDPRLRDAWFVSYEALRANPRDRLREIRNYATTFSRTWSSLDPDAVEPGRPSATDFRGTGASSTVASWGDLEPSLVERAVATLRDVGLDGLYGASPACLADVNEFVRDHRRRRASR